MRCCTKVTNALTVMHLHKSHMLPICDVIHFLCSITQFSHNIVCRMGNGAFCLAFLFLFRFKLKNSWCITNILLVHPSHPITLCSGFGGGSLRRFHCYVSWRMSKMHFDTHENSKVLARSLYYTAYFNLHLFLWWAIIFGPNFPLSVDLETRKTWYLLIFLRKFEHFQLLLFKVTCSSLIAGSQKWWILVVNKMVHALVVLKSCFLGMKRLFLFLVSGVMCSIIYKYLCV